ncbi:TlpA family protein disulfide reductase [Micromonospora sp. DT4]|uniref:TlpA family protein disulfide reductase n=1 Tax=Micromonospora sp. DT4 TaxID=3393438 RepID=UPI003CEEDF6A
MRRRAVLAGATVVAVTALTGCDDGTEPSAVADTRDTGPLTPKTVYPAGQRPDAPTLDGELLDGTTFDLATRTGKVAVINFWASWCAPCRAETDDLEAVYQATRDDGVTLLGINTRDSRDAATAFVQGRVGYPSLFDPAGRVAMGFNHVQASFLPATVLLDRTGRVAVVFRKALVRTELEPVVTDLAAEKI